MWIYTVRPHICMGAPPIHVIMHIARASLFRATRDATRNTSAAANRDGMAPLSTAEADAWEAFLRAPPPAAGPSHGPSVRAGEPGAPSLGCASVGTARHVLRPDPLPRARVPCYPARLNHESKAYISIMRMFLFSGPGREPGPCSSGPYHGTLQSSNQGRGELKSRPRMGQLRALCRNASAATDLIVVVIVSRAGVALRGLVRVRPRRLLKSLLHRRVVAAHCRLPLVLRRNQLLLRRHAMFLLILHADVDGHVGPAVDSLRKLGLGKPGTLGQRGSHRFFVDERISGRT